MSFIKITEYFFLYFGGCHWNPFLYPNFASNNFTIIIFGFSTTTLPSIVSFIKINKYLYFWGLGGITKTPFCTLISHPINLLFSFLDSALRHYLIINIVSFIKINKYLYFGGSGGITWTPIYAKICAKITM